MHYDPIKRSLGVVFNKSPFLRKTFYRLLDLLLLRAWHIHKELRLWLAKHAGPLNILDAGAGFGQYTYWLASRNRAFNIYSVDVKQEQVLDCNNFFSRIGMHQVKFGVEDLTVYQSPETYHLIVCVDVMEHILEDEKVFSNYAASLKTGGMLIISTPSDQGGSDVHADDQTSFIEEHVRDGYNILEIIHEISNFYSGSIQNILRYFTFLLSDSLSVLLYFKLFGCTNSTQNRYRSYCKGLEIVRHTLAAPLIVQILTESLF